MQPTTPILIPVAANDLPQPEHAERARRPSRERRLRGPAWEAPSRQLQSA